MLSMTLVLSCDSIGVLRYQIYPSSNGVHCIIAEGGLRPNIINGSSALDCHIRFPAQGNGRGAL